ncbi:MAG: hypothetical protein D6722_25290 [Bacteroidetes bacterium]|nr:MAG: hypothetical protein D6722_25290 [Bacteroidota bacterium]
MGDGCAEEHARSQSMAVEKIPAPQLRRMSYEQYGINAREYRVSQAQVQPGTFLTDLLQAQQVDVATINAVTRKAEGIFDIRRMQAGHSYTLLKDAENRLDYFIYELTEADFVVIDLRDSVSVYRGAKHITARMQAAAGFIETSLYESLEKYDLDPGLRPLLEDIFAWTVDFSHLEAGDYFKVLYEEEYVDQIPTGVRAIVAALFHHDGIDYYAIRFQQDSTIAYFDQEGQSVKRAFLKVPLAWSEEAGDLPLSHRFASGQDFYAPKGTPVVAVGTGKVIRMRPRQGHMSYLSIKHTGVLITQYMHLSGWPETLAVGDTVRQGDTIAYVGRPGKSDYHVRLRYWKNGQPVSPLKLELPDPVPIYPENEEAYAHLSTEMMGRLSQIELPANPRFAQQ